MIFLFPARGNFRSNVGEMIVLNGRGATPPEPMKSRSGHLLTTARSPMRAGLNVELTKERLEITKDIPLAQVVDWMTWKNFNESSNCGSRFEKTPKEER